MGTMQEIFPEFYQPKKEELDDLLNDSIIVIDTNYLLDILRLKTKNANHFIKALEIAKDNLYIPYMVALEFHFNKATEKKRTENNKKVLLDKLTSKFNKRDEKIENAREEMQEEIDADPTLNTIKKRFGDDLSTLNLEEYFNQLSEDIAQKESEFFQQIEDMYEKEFIKDSQQVYERLIKAMDNTVGKAYEQDWIKVIEDEGEQRYKDKIPPGFADEEKDKKNDGKESVRYYDEIKYRKKYADLIIWKDILKYAKDSEGKRVIFVTDDKKDIFYTAGRDLTIGPHIHMLNEIKKKTGKDFYVFQNDEFVQQLLRLNEDDAEDLKQDSYDVRTMQSALNNAVRPIVNTTLSAIKPQIDALNSQVDIIRPQIEAAKSVTQFSSAMQEALQTNKAIAESTSVMMNAYRNMIPPLSSAYPYVSNIDKDNQSQNNINDEDIVDDNDEEDDDENDMQMKV